MPTNFLLKIICLSCFFCLIISSILLKIIGATKILESVVGISAFILMSTIFINGVFYKELIYKGVCYKGALPIFVGLMMGISAVLALFLTIWK